MGTFLRGKSSPLQGRAIATTCLRDVSLRVDRALVDAGALVGTDELDHFVEIRAPGRRRAG
jgi:hypothetical protein